MLLADMDSTMIEQECIDELAVEAGVGEEVAQITARAMNGELDFEQALQERTGLLKGLAVEIIDKVYQTRITYMPGGAQLLATMKAHGAYADLVSGGFTDFTTKVAHKLGFDSHRANRLLQADHHLTGEVAHPILGQQAKVTALNELTAARGLRLKMYWPLEMAPMIWACCNWPGPAWRFMPNLSFKSRCRCASIMVI